MSKQGEIDYLKNLGKEGIKHAVNKPFSDENCGALITELGAVISLLPSPPARILDLGCGTGWTSSFLAKRGYDVTGIDISEDMIKYANINKNKEDLKNLQFIIGDYEDMDFNCEFDCAISYDSLHHSQNEEKAMKAVYNALRPGGIFIISEPGKGHRNTLIAIDVMKRYDVTEKDMPPYLIIKYGKRAGFKDFKVYPRACHINFALYTNQNKIPRLNFLKKLFRFDFIRTIAAVFVITFYKRYDGIVLMIK